MTNLPDNTFAAACYNDLTVAQLEAELCNPADPTDCRTWNLTPAQWRDAIALALKCRREEMTL